MPPELDRPPRFQINGHAALSRAKGMHVPVSRQNTVGSRSERGTSRPVAISFVGELGSIAFAK